MTYLIIDEDKGTITESRDQYHHKPTLESWDIIEKKDRIIISGRQIIFEFDWHNAIPLKDIEEEYIFTKKFLWWTWKATNGGWVALKKREPYIVEFVGTYKLLNVIRKHQRQV